MPDSPNPTLILGGGFTGLFTALHLSHQHFPKPIILINKEERFVFKPLLYEFLSGEMDANQVCPRYEELLDKSGVTFIQDTIEAIDLLNKQVNLNSGLSYTYSQLVLALGSTTGYFNVEGAQKNSFPFRTAHDAIALKRHLRDCLQRASQTDNDQQRRSLLTVAVIGAGPSGVELAATLSDLLPHWYTQLGGKVEEIRMVLLNRGTEILQENTNSLRSTAHNALQQRLVPVELLMEAEIVAIRPNLVEFQRHDSCKAIAAATIIWTAGTATHPLIKALPIAPEHRDQRDRLKVTPTLQLPDFPEVFAGGDCTVDMQGPLPATAQVAYQQGAAIAHNLKGILAGDSLSPAHIRLRGTLLKLGLAQSAAEIFDRFEVKGKLGHLIRVGAYLELLPTPVHDFKATTEWLTDEIFYRFMPSTS